MKYIFIALAACFGGMHAGIMGSTLAVLAMIPLILCVSRLHTQYLHVCKLREYAVRTENIYVCAEYEHDNTVRARAAHERKILHDSGNNTNITVHELYFGFGEHCNENFEQYQERVKHYIEQDRIKRHKDLSSKYVDFYITHALNQV